MKVIKRLLAILGVLLVLVIAAGAALTAYGNDALQAEPKAVAAAQGAIKDGDHCLAFLPEASEGGVIKTGIIFYPGAKVQPEAYAPLAKACADRGYAFVICPMPINLAMFGVHTADKVFEEYPQVQQWYSAGHSMGGMVALAYASEHPDKVVGNIGLAVFITDDVSAKGVRMLSITADQDGLTSPEKYKKYEKNLPVDHVNVVIAGGNHAGFGNYGVQPGDGPAIISKDEQLQKTVDAICEFLG